MKTSYIALGLCGVLAVTGCARLADSRLNPVNWFDRSPQTQNASGQTTDAGPIALPPIIPPSYAPTQTVDARVPVSRVTNVTISPVTGGVLITATG
ncbi:MAG: hypothetical protein AAF701_05960, partial [Pseudomonadota bacterium]